MVKRCCCRRWVLVSSTGSSEGAYGVFGENAPLGLTFTLFGFRSCDYVEFRKCTPGLCILGVNLESFMYGDQLFLAKFMFIAKPIPLLDFVDVSSGCSFGDSIVGLSAEVTSILFHLC